MLVISGEWKQLSERLNEATKLRITAENQAGEAKSELVILQVICLLCGLVINLFEECFSNMAVINHLVMHLQNSPTCYLTVLLQEKSQCLVIET